MEEARGVSWGYPLAPALFIVASAWMLFYTASLRPKESALGLLTILLGAGLYFGKFRQGSVPPAAACRRGFALACSSQRGLSPVMGTLLLI